MTILPQRDSVEFSSGLLAGALIGAGVALLLAPDRSPRGRFRRRLRKPGRKVRRQVTQTRQSADETLRRSQRLKGELGSFGSEFLRAAREELVSAGLQSLTGRRRTTPRGRLHDAAKKLKRFQEGSPSGGG
jgi:gas vesicle protein